MYDKAIYLDHSTNILFRKCYVFKKEKKK